MPVGSGGGGGGASAGDVRAGGAYFELLARESVTKTLDQIEKKWKGLKSSFGGFGGALAGGIIGGAFGSGLVGVLEKAGSKLADWVTHAEAFNKELEKSLKLGSAIAKLLGEGQARENQRIDQLPDAARILDLEKEVTRTQNERAGTAERLKTAQEKVSNPSIKTARDRGLGLFAALGESIGINPATDRFKQALQEAEAAHQTAMENAAAAQRRFDDFKAESETRMMNEKAFSNLRSGGAFGGFGSFIEAGFGEFAQMVDRGIQGRTIDNLKGLRADIGNPFALNALLLQSGLEKVGRVTELMRTASEVRTGAGGQNALQRFGVGSQGLDAKQLEIQKELLKDQKEKLARRVGQEVAQAMFMR